MSLMKSVQNYVAKTIGLGIWSELMVFYNNAADSEGKQSFISRYEHQCFQKK
jgi:hypothetical protein